MRRQTCFELKVIITRRICVVDPFKGLALKIVISPTVVGGLFRSTYNQRYSGCFFNPTNGSWWILQVQPRCCQTPESGRKGTIHQLPLVGVSHLFVRSFLGWI